MGWQHNIVVSPHSLVDGISNDECIPGGITVNAGNSRHIFFIDDKPEICQVIAATFEQQNFKVTCFTCATDCLDRLTSEKCDLIITDLRMPEMDGLELLRQAKILIP
jgi:response regulator RpfG family c-di-GMP phosphodiesterase